MNIDFCPLYALKSKRFLKYLLAIDDNRLLKQKYVASLVSPYIYMQNKPRLIEPPSMELKRIQKRIKNLLGTIPIPENIFSGIKGRSYVDNAKMHLDTSSLRNMIKIDLTAFFPSISRNVVYRFFYKDLQCSSDVAEILTNLTTIDLSRSSATDLSSIYGFLDMKHVNCYNHLISGSPASPILSYLVNKRMFDELQKLADLHNMTMSVYIDDVIFSSRMRISNYFYRKVCLIIKKYGYQISKKKVKVYTKNSPKLVTGVVIDRKGRPVVRNSIKFRIIDLYRKLMKNPSDERLLESLRGLLVCARQVDKNAFPTIYRYAFLERIIVNNV